MIRCFGLTCILAVLLLAGCSPERNLARHYVKTHNGTGIMIVPLYELYKDNLTLNYDTAIKYSPDQLDSLAWEQSCFINHVSDSVFLTLFTNSLISMLTIEGYDVYMDGSSDIFLSLPDPKWMVQIAQLQLDEEHLYNYTELYSTETGEPFTDSLRINQVTLSSWFDVSRANAGNKQVLFLEGYIQDNIKRGVDFNLMEGSIGLEQNRDSVDIDDVYRMAYDLGKKHAELLYDYFINDYIRENLPSGIIHRKYFHFDQKSKSLKPGQKERFDVVN
jgi:hypothetical protein